MTRLANRRRVLTKPRIAVVVLGVTVTSLLPLVGAHPLDLQVYRLGGWTVLHGHPLYAQRIGSYCFTYPPFAAVLAVPFALVPFATASVLSASASLASLVVVLRRGTGDLLRARSVWATVALLALACCAPVRGTFWNGQVNLLLAALVLADVRGRRLGGIGVGLAAAVKLTPAIFALYLLVSGRRREAARAAATFAAAAAYGWAVLPADSARYWGHVLVGSGRSSGIGDEARTSDQSIHGLVLRLLGVGPVDAIWLPLAGAALVVGLRIAMRLTREGRESFAVGVVGVTGCVVSPVSWVHHWVWAVPWLVGLAHAARRPATRVWVGLVGVVVVGWDQLPLGALPAWPLVSFVGRNDLVLCAVLTGLATFAPRRPGPFTKNRPRIGAAARAVRLT